MIPFFKREQKIFLIANVATHPEYRRQGIARQLTAAAMQKARERHASAIWLHVRDDNPGAIQLYRELGFVERARRTNWATQTGAAAAIKRPPNLAISARAAWDWSAQAKWLARAYPAELDWYNHQNRNLLRPGLIYAIYRFLAEINIMQWSATQDGRLQGVLAYQRTSGRADQLWAALPAHASPDAVTGLLTHCRQHIPSTRSLALEYPVGAMDDAIRAAGLVAQRTLAWMEAPGAGTTTF
jgi:hypothetical protein